jgi:glycerol-3-phosphate dehydrogenase
MAKLSATAQGTFDLLIVGGGVIGAGIARDAALRGLQVALFEKGDFGGGTTAGSARLVHGGLRYLGPFHRIKREFPLCIDGALR